MKTPEEPIEYPVDRTKVTTYSVPSDLPIIEANKEDALVRVDNQEFRLYYSSNNMLHGGEPIYEDLEEFVIEHMSTLDESLVEKIVTQVAKKILPFVEQYLPDMP